MDMQQMQQQVDEIQRKLDLILDEIALQQRHRREVDDLRDDLMRVGKDLYDTAVVELEDVHDYLKTGDVSHLGKKILRNVTTLSKMFEQLESFRDFLQDSAPLARESFVDAMKRMDELDRKGYFQFAKELGRVADTIVTSFTPEDVKHLGENIVTILNTVKNLTQPDMLHSINNAVSVYNKLDFEVHERVSLGQLIRELSTPEARRGLVFAIRFLKSLATGNGMQARGLHHT